MPEMAPFDVDVITDTSWQNYTQIVFELNYLGNFLVSTCQMHTYLLPIKNRSNFSSLKTHYIFRNLKGNIWATFAVKETLHKAWITSELLYLKQLCLLVENLQIKRKWAGESSLLQSR